MVVVGPSLHGREDGKVYSVLKVVLVALIGLTKGYSPLPLLPALSVKNYAPPWAPKAFVGRGGDDITVIERTEALLQNATPWIPWSENINQYSEVSL